jgi:hypothetical protein
MVSIMMDLYTILGMAMGFLVFIIVIDKMG